MSVKIQPEVTKEKKKKETKEKNRKETKFI